MEGYLVTENYHGTELKHAVVFNREMVDDVVKIVSRHSFGDVGRFQWKVVEIEMKEKK